MIHITTDELSATQAKSIILTLPIIRKTNNLFFYKFKTLRSYLKVVSDYASLCLKTRSYDKRVLKLNSKPHAVPMPGQLHRYKITPYRISGLPKKLREIWESKDNLLIIWTAGKSNTINKVSDKVKRIFDTKLRTVITTSYALELLPYSGSNKDRIEYTLECVKHILVDVYVHVPKSQEALALKLVKKYNAKPPAKKTWRVPRIKVPDVKKVKRKKIKSNRVR